MDEQRGPAWRKSTLSGPDQCVEWAASPDGRHVLLRDSRNPAGPELVFTLAEWRAFVGGVRAGEADL